MALFNHTTQDLTAKIVYYGPGLCGKTTNLRLLHDQLDRTGSRKLLSLATAQDRTIYFDLLPVELGNIKGYTVRFQLCTVPGQVFYNETRKIVLRGVDGIVFVVDSQGPMLSHNLESFQNLRENLREENVSLETLPLVVQYNKRDLPSALAVPTLQESLGFGQFPFVEAVAAEGQGVVETFRLISKLTFVDLLRRLQRGGTPTTVTATEALAAASEALPPAAPAAAPEPVFTPAEAAPEPPAPPLSESAAEEPPRETSPEEAFPGLDDDETLESPPAPGPVFAREPSSPGAVLPELVLPPAGRTAAEADLGTTRAIEAPVTLLELPPEPVAPAPPGEAGAPEAIAAQAAAVAAAPAADTTQQIASAPDEAEVRRLEDSLTRAVQSISEESARREEAEERQNRRIAGLEEEIQSLKRELVESRDREEAMKALTEGLSRRWEALRRLLLAEDASRE